MKNTVIRRADILLPAEHISNEKWAVVAVDQYTSEPEYWRQVEEIVGDSPSTLRLTLPEVYLKESEIRTHNMQAAMRGYLADNILEEKNRIGSVMRHDRNLPAYCDAAPSGSSCG